MEEKEGGLERGKEEMGFPTFEESSQAQKPCIKRVLGKKTAFCQKGEEPTHGTGHAVTLIFEFLVLAKL